LKSGADDTEDGLELVGAGLEARGVDDGADTGIDVPEVVNLVFFKIVRSKTKFWQMLGRGTRLCPDLFGPGRHKTHFSVFDFCQNFEFFNQHPDISDGAVGDSLSKRLFVARVELIAALDALAQKPGTEGASSGVAGEPEPFEAADDLRAAVATMLRAEVAGMTPNNFIVRPKRRLVEKYSEPEAWRRLGLDAQAELAGEVAGLPSTITDDDIAAKQFDALILRTQLSVLRTEASYAGLRTKIVQIAALLEDLSNVPMVAAELALIQEIQADDFWQDVTAPMLETVRRHLRALIKLIELKKRPIVYTDFEDQIGEASQVDLRGVAVGTDMDRLRAKARHFLAGHRDHIAIAKLHRNEPLTPTDLAELKRIFVESGIAETADLERLRLEGGLGLFVRSLVGLDRQAAKNAFNDFLASRTLSSNQIEFLNQIIDHLTEKGQMDSSLLYESPFTDFDPWA